MLNNSQMGLYDMAQDVGAPGIDRVTNMKPLSA